MASDPLAGLFQSIQEATVIPSPAEYRPDDNDPIFRLISANEKPVISKTSSAKSTAPRTTSTLQTDQLSERTRKAISNRPLQGPARIQAVDLALQALENPTKEQIESILEILISG